MTRKTTSGTTSQNDAKIVRTKRRYAKMNTGPPLVLPGRKVVGIERKTSRDYCEVCGQKKRACQC